jgi:serine/threonine-protein kinase
MLLVPGALITPNVRLVRLLGKGGMGSVWVADHLTLRTQVAVKFISDEHTQDADALERFSREATAAAQIKSPHVVQVFDHGVYAGSPYIVMELLEGEDLAARIDRRGPLSLTEVAAILQQIGKALMQAHAVGIVHRDIKPANAFLTVAGGELLVKVLDFGVAKITRPGQDPSYRMTQTGQLVGTPCYMSPEQVFGRGDIDFRVDLWALGVLAYEAATGELPFMGKTLGDMYLSINSAIFTLPSRVDRVFPRALDGWFERAFAKDPKERFGSAKEMVDAFVAVAGRYPNVRRASAPRGDASGPAAGAKTEMIVAASPARPPPARLGVVLGVIAGAALAGVLGVIVLFRARAAEPPVPQPPVAVTATPASADTATAQPSATASASAAPDVSPAPDATAAQTATPAAPTQHPVASPGTARPPVPVPSGKKRRDHGF